MNPLNIAKYVIISCVCIISQSFHLVCVFESFALHVHVPESVKNFNLPIYLYNIYKLSNIEIQITDSTL